MNFAAWPMTPLIWSCAREALQAVISERGLKIQLALAPPPAQPLESSDGNDLIDDPEDPEDPDYRLVSVRTSGWRIAG